MITNSTPDNHISSFLFENSTLKSNINIFSPTFANSLLFFSRKLAAISAILWPLAMLITLKPVLRDSKINLMQGCVKIVSFEKGRREWLVHNYLVSDK